MATAAGRGEHWALTQLFRAYQPMLIRYLRGQERRLADDLAGEVWVAVAQRLGQFEGDELGFRRWLFTIARCRVIEHRRKAARRRTDPVSHDRLDAPDAARLAVDPALVVVDRLSSQEAIDSIVEGLTADHVAALLNVFGEGAVFGHHGIAVVLRVVRPVLFVLVDEAEVLHSIPPVVWIK